MSRLRLLLDVDNVLCDFQSAALRVQADVLGTPLRTLDSFDTWDVFAHLSPDERARVGAVIDEPGWCSRLEPYPDAQRVIAAMREHYDVFAVTSPWRTSPTWTYDRARWLWERFAIPHKNIVFTKAKHLVDGDVFIDDSPTNVEAWRRAHFWYPKLGITFVLPNTRTIVDRQQDYVESWADIELRLALRPVWSGEVQWGGEHYEAGIVQRPGSRGYEFTVLQSGRMSEPSVGLRGYIARVAFRESLHGSTEASRTLAQGLLASCEVMLET